jgi:hypothetical protein
MSERDLTAQVEYRPIPGFTGYKAGSDGSIWSCWEMSWPKGRIGIEWVATDQWHKLKPGQNRSGHLHVHMRADGGVSKKNVAVHHLILISFVGPRPEGLEGCHNDGNPANNAASNLRWDTHRENLRDRHRHGTYTEGERHGAAKLTESQVHEIRELLRAGSRAKDIAGRFGVTASTITQIRVGATWKHLPPIDIPVRRIQSAEQVREIRRRYRDGARQSDLCREFGLSSGSMSLLVRGVIWKNVE